MGRHTRAHYYRNNTYFIDSGATKGDGIGAAIAAANAVAGAYDTMSSEV
jgi:hypothetical protein